MSSSPQPMPDFEDIVLRFTRQIYYAEETVFQLEVQQSPAPLPGGAFRADIDAQAQQLYEQFTQRVHIQQFFDRFAVPATLDTTSQDIAALGRQLFTMLPLAFQQALPRLLQQVFESGHGIRLILEARAGHKADRLLALPWELLFFEFAGNSLAHSPRVVVVRRLLDAVRRSPSAIKPPFNVLHLIADHAGAPPQYRIDDKLKQTERERIPAATSPGHYHLVSSPGSVEQLLAALREQPYHIIHFLGHGEAQRYATSDEQLLERGYLLFAGRDGTPQWVTGEQLQHLLEFSATTQLVVLNACHGGANVARSVALELVYHGLPYVVAIQGDILQPAAQHFIAAFYSEVQRGSAIEYAVAVGRAAIAAQMPQTLDWCLPVLYTSAGLAAPAPTLQNAAKLWHWASEPSTRKTLQRSNLLLGGLHLGVGILLLLSGQVLALPDPGIAHGITALAALLPILIAGIYWRTLPALPTHWPKTARQALALRAISAAAMGMALPMLYAWIVLLLLVGIGLWQILTPLAHVALLASIFIPALIFSSRLSYSQTWGHTQSLFSQAPIQMPALDWGELVIPLGAYLLLFLPSLLLHLATGALTPPWGNFWTGVLLLALSFALGKDETRP